MFESLFNLKFNLVKAYADIGIPEDDDELGASIYGLATWEYKEALEGFAKNNRENAAEVLAAYEACFGAFRPDKETPYRIAWLGDSITSDRESHQCIIRELLKDCPNLTLWDFAVSGFKASDLFTHYYPDISDFAPDIAVLMIGTNDMRIMDDEYGYNHGGIEEFSRNIDYLTAKLAAAGTRVIVCTLPPFDMGKMRIALDGWHILYTEEGRRLYDDAIVSAAGRHGAVLVDMRAVYAEYDAADITIDDGLHLNGKGQTLLAMNIFPKLAKMIGAAG